MSGYWILFGIAVAIFAIETAVFFRNMVLIRRRNSRQLRRNINNYSN